MSDFSEFPGLAPAHFFRFAHQFHYCKTANLSKEHLLPDTSSFLGEVSFAKVYAGWNEEGLYFTIEASFSSPESSVELFIDTRDIKTSGYNTRFCHHFLFLTEENEERASGEITHFRGLEKRELANASLLKKEMSRGKMHLFIPKAALVGFEPTQFDRIGFNYRIKASEDFIQHFSASSPDFKIEEEPSTWASIKLVK